jgi:undecaprenyl-diphosphatase
LIIAINSIVFGLALYAADAYGVNRNRVADITPKTALYIGLAQMLALNPGTSRSGITMTAGRALGFLRSDAARFSFLISIPANAAGSIVKIGSAIKNHDPITGPMILCGVLTFFIGLITIAPRYSGRRFAGFDLFRLHIWQAELTGFTEPIKIARDNRFNCSRRDAEAL